jgi:hypothetical protein
MKHNEKKDEIKWDNATKGADHYIKELTGWWPNAEWKYAVFIGDGGDWGGPSSLIVKEMKIPNAKFERSETTDAWVYPNGKIELTEYKNHPCPNPGIVTKTINTKNIVGIDDYCNPNIDDKYFNS